MFDVVNKNSNFGSVKQITKKKSRFTKFNITWFLWNLYISCIPNDENITQLNRTNFWSSCRTCRRWLAVYKWSTKYILHMLYWIQIRWECWPVYMGDILWFKAFDYDNCTLGTGDVIHKCIFCAHGTSKQTQILLQSDVPIDLASHTVPIKTFMPVCNPE